MNSDLEFETFFYVSNEKLLLSVFKKGLDKDIYKDEIYLNDNSEIIESKINQFLDKNIIKVEKEIKNFINQINLIIKDDDILPIQISIKKQSSGKKITVNELNYMCKDLSQQIKENNNDKVILHMNIKEFIVDGQVLTNLDKQFESDDLSLEASFYCYPKIKIKRFSDYLKRYQITINRTYSIDYLKKYFLNSELNECQMALKIEDLGDINEVKLVPKFQKNTGFFEKFFNLFNK